MARIIEAKAVISGEDRLSGILDKVARKTRELGKGIKASARLDDLNRSLGQTKKQLAAIERVNLAQSRLASAKLGYAGAPDEASRAAATRAIQRQTRAVAEARREVAGFGVPIGNMVAHERALKESVDKTTAAIQRETAALERRDRVQAKWDERRRHRAVAAEASRRKATTERAVGNEGSGLGTAALLRGAAPIVAPYLVGAEVKRELRTYADLEKAVTSLGVTAEATDAQVKAATETFRREGPGLGVDAKEMARAAEMYVAAGLDFDTAVNSAAKTVKASKASGGTLEDLTSAGIAAMQQYGFTAKNLERAFDLMAKGGKEGRYELKNMAADLPSVGAGAKRLGLDGEKGLAKSVAALETIREVVGSPEEAANRWENVVQKAFIQETQKNFKKMGINLEKEIKDGAKKGKDALDVLLDATERATKGDEFKIAALFNDSQAMQGMQALLQNRKKLNDLTAKIMSEAAGTIARDFERVSKTTDEGFKRLSASIDRATGRMGEALAPMAGKIASEIEEALDRIDKGQTLLSRWEAERRARETAAGRDPDADRKQYEADQREIQAHVDDFEKRVFGNKRGLRGVLFPEQSEIDEAVRKAREAGLKERADAERSRAEAAAQARNRQLGQELRQGYRAPTGSPMPKATVSAMDAEEADRLANLEREFGDMASKAELERIDARLKRMEGPGFGDFGKPGKGRKGPEITAPAAPLTRDPTAPGPSLGFNSQPLTAQVTGPVPVSVTGDVKGTVEVGGTLNIVPTPLFTATFAGFERRVASVEGKVASFGSLVAANGPGSTGKSSPDAGKGGRE
ncbi:MAG: phage tail tape measure protein [Methylorubrum rhodinum]|uniref:phage tail tape measure protein n=1 Tax=Methylorubrum rhodinum TaxID=29428 RepID=UPI003BAEE656